MFYSRVLLFSIRKWLIRVGSGIWESRGRWGREHRGEGCCLTLPSGTNLVRGAGHAPSAEPLGSGSNQQLAGVLCQRCLINPCGPPGFSSGNCFCNPAKHNCLCFPDCYALGKIYHYCKCSCSFYSRYFTSCIQQCKWSVFTRRLL